MVSIYNDFMGINTIELEAKFKLDSKDAVDALVETIDKKGGVFKYKRFEVNEFFDTKTQKLDRKGELIRLRTMKTGDVTSMVVTYKGKQTKGAKFKSREEHEFEITSAASFHRTMEALGYTNSFTFEKERMTFELNNCLVEIDYLPKLGYYCEIEGKSESAIERVMRSIGYGDAQPINQGYGTLIRNYHKKKKIKLKAMRF